MDIKKVISAIVLCLLSGVSVEAFAIEYHVAKHGSDSNQGSLKNPFLIIQKAADVAQPGDTVTIHEGIYRERINPPRGGTSDAKRITYQAASGEKVIIKGSEVVKGWKKLKNDTWKVTIPNSFFGDINPYSNLIKGDWFDPKERDHHTGAVYLDGHWMIEAAKLEDVLKPIGRADAAWFAEVDQENTQIYARFKDVDPNKKGIEINVRQAVFYPEQPGMNYITVKGFTMEHAATPWSPPTAEQVGLIGTNWSKGWIIEDNDISYSTCTGVTLGKYGDEHDNTSADTAEGYVKTIERALARGWSKENIGSHIVHNNHISHCEQAGLVGSMGAVFSKITNNDIHDIHTRQLFTGAEMAGIKIHGAIDTEISGNHIYDTCLGIWLDWMTQGTRVTGNLLHDNSQDLFVEVNHGPFMVDNNILLSRNSLLVNSQGAAYVHNLIAGQVNVLVSEGRQTPYLKAHSTEVAGLAPNPSGDERYYNNIFVNGGLSSYDRAKLPVFMSGNVFLNGAKPSKHEQNPFVKADFNPSLKLIEKDDGVYLQLTTQAYKTLKTRLVTTELLGRAIAPNLAYEKADGTPYRLDTDYFGKQRNPENLSPGAIEFQGEKVLSLKVWPKSDFEQ